MLLTQRPTIIKVEEAWTKTSLKSLLGPSTTETLDQDQQKVERNSAFDLLDALTRSGDLPIDHAELHVVLAATHCFEQTLINTVIQDNVNPIEKVERSTLIMASTIQNLPVRDLIEASQVQRVHTFSPKLLELGSHPCSA